MKLYFGNIEIKPGMLRFGNEEPDRVYFGENLVYQSYLKSGTVLWTGTIKPIQYNPTQNAILAPVSDDWSNVDPQSKLNFEYKAKNGYVSTVSASLSDVKKGKSITPDGSELLTVKIGLNNILYINLYHETLTKISIL